MVFQGANPIPGEDKLLIPYFEMDDGIDCSVINSMNNAFGFRIINKPILLKYIKECYKLGCVYGGSDEKALQSYIKEITIRLTYLLVANNKCDRNLM